MTTFITIIYVIVALVMILSILLQAGKGGGLGSALGGGASQSVFGGGGGADFMSKLTQGFAATFMITAMYLAYASAHAGSDFLEESDEGSEGVLEADAEINPERLGPRPQTLPSAEAAKALQAKAAELVPPISELPADILDESQPEQPAPEPAPEPAEEPASENTQPAEQPAEQLAEQPAAVDEAAPADTDRGDSPDEERGESPHSGKDGLGDSVPSKENQDADNDSNSDDKSPED